MEIESHLLLVTYLLFIDNLGFLAANNSVIEIKRIPKKARKTIFDWETCNAVTYDISKIGAMLFSKARKQKLLKQLTTT